MLSIEIRVSLVILASFFLSLESGSTKAEVKFSKHILIVCIIKVYHQIISMQIIPIYSRDLMQIVFIVCMPMYIYTYRLSVFILMYKEED